MRLYRFTFYVYFFLILLCLFEHYEWSPTTPGSLNLEFLILKDDTGHRVMLTYKLWFWLTTLASLCPQTSKKEEYLLL
jgi:hypothetical protein